MYNVSFWFSKMCWLLCPNHAIIRSNQANLIVFHRWLLVILFNSNASPENDPAYRIIRFILTFIPNKLLGKTLVYGILTCRRSCFALFESTITCKNLHIFCFSSCDTS